jgi:cysteine desulfurase
MSLYLDHNASTTVRPEAIEAVVRALQAGGNASSIHARGRAARAIMEGAREAVADLIAAPASTIVFTSGGAEANSLAMGSALATGSRRLLVSAIEHATVLETAKATAPAHELMPVTRDGVADLAWLRERLARWDAADGRPFVALMLANNETGVIQPIAEAAEIIRAADGWLHVDAIQAVGKVPVDSRALGADTLSFSGHKLGAPQGVGGLTFGPRATLVRLQHGGGHERGRRAGTENIPGIAGLGATARIARDHLDDAARQAAWRDAAAERLKGAGAVVIGEGAPRLPNTLSIAMAGWPADRQVIALDLAGVMVSAGSACSSGKVKASHVLQAMDLGELAGCAIRVSGGWDSTADDWNRFAEVWLEAYARHAVRRKEVA